MRSWCYRTDPWGAKALLLKLAPSYLGSLCHGGFFAHNQGIGIMALNAIV